MMTEKPQVNTFEDGTKMWTHTYDTFKVKVYVPAEDDSLRADIINYGFLAPYLLVFTEEDITEE